MDIDNSLDFKKLSYEENLRFLKSLLKGEFNPIANMANYSSFIYSAIDNLNWVGFYLLDENELILGPFAGKTACVRIDVGKGVCGSAIAKNRIINVADVHSFPGHIACDVNSKSELVIPINKNGLKYGVLDIDSPLIDRFHEELEQFFINSLNILMEETDFSILEKIYKPTIST
jgi:GAF domain-containing protein